jgi:hypothetical protein
MALNGSPHAVKNTCSRWTKLFVPTPRWNDVDVDVILVILLSPLNGVILDVMFGLVTTPFRRQTVVSTSSE